MRNEEVSKLPERPRGELSQGLVPASSGWELVKVVFGEALNAPEVYRSPIIAWDISHDKPLPVFPYPWYRPKKEDIEMETDYQAYLCPNGSVVGYEGLLEERVNLQRFVDICMYMEAVMRRDTDWNPGPIDPSLPRRFSR